MRELKSTRIKFQSTKQLFDEKKEKYDSTASSLVSERLDIERECNSLQKEWLEMERNYHHLSNANEIAKVNLERVRMENRWRTGTEKMLPDFESLKDLYGNKLEQQENMAKQLRKEQKILKENKEEY